MTSRRRLLIAFGAAAVSPRMAPAQSKQAPGKVFRVAHLSPLSPADAETWHQAFRLGLRDLGWVEGRNVSIEQRYAESHSDRIPALAAELVHLKVDVIVAANPTTALAAQKATRAIPIVVVAAGDPVAYGLAESLARPGGNITGLSTMTFELSGKRLELLKEMIPRLSRVAVLWNPHGPAGMLNWKEIQAPARQLGLQLHSMEVRSPDDFDKAFEAAAKARAGALTILPDSMITVNLKRVADLAARSRLPAIYHFSEFAEAGGLATYGADRTDLYRRAAGFVDKILKGAKPGDLPIDQPTKFEMVINLKTAQALGLTIPRSVLLQADRLMK